MQLNISPGLPNWKTDAVRAESFEKAVRIAMCKDRLEIRSDLDERGFLLSDEDIGAVIDGDTRDIRLLITACQH